VRDKKSFILSPGHTDETSEKGLFLDIFPADRFHLDPLVFCSERWMKTYNKFICLCLDSVNFANESMIRRILSYFHPVFHFLVLQYQHFAAKRIERNKKLGANCRIGHGFDTLWNRYYNYDDIYPLIEIPFEDATFFAPRNPDAYLTTIYGPDYMTLPPEDQRTQHASVIKPIL
jgi:lipopolysaccharide cholinephosphotransferase